jgi:hypothetical protein
MDDQAPHEHAENCRRQALSYLGRPEAPFLLRLAREFERIDKEVSDGGKGGVKARA